MSQEKKKEFIVNVLFITAIIALAYFLFKYLLVWLMPFAVGLLLAVILQHPINWILDHTALKRSVVAPVIIGILLVIFFTCIFFLSIHALHEFISFVSGIPGIVQNVLPQVIHAVNLRLERLIDLLPNEWETSIRVWIRTFSQTLQSKVGEGSATVLTAAANAATALPGMLIRMIITVVATFFISANYDKIRAFLGRQIPERYRGLASETLVTFWHTLRKMLTSYLLIMLITFCELAVGLMALRVDYHLLVAALIALLDILPVLGTGTVLIPWGIIALLLGDTLTGIGLLLLYLVIMVVRNIIEPRLIGRRIGLPPLVTLMAMYLGLHILGIPGMFLLPLLLILLKNAQDAGVIHVWND